MNAPCCTICRKPLSKGVCTRCDNSSQTAAGANEARSRAAAPPNAARFGQYRLLRELGRGGMGRVLEAVDEPLGRRVAVKVLLTARAGRTIESQRFLEEARIAGRLEHPGIVPIYNLGRGPDGNLYFSMKLVAGRDLDELLKEREKGNREIAQEYTLPRLLSVFERVVETVAYAHSQEFLHRDLKPANIMVGGHGEVWVLDWGLAKALGKYEPAPVPAAPAATPPVSPGSSDLTAAGSLVGTPQYMAPEQAKGGAVDVRTDVFGLGGILYRVLTGKSPNQGPDYMGTVVNAALGEIAPVRSWPSGRQAPAELAAIAEKCLAAQPVNRYASANELLADLRAYLAGEATKARPDGPLSRALRLARKHGRLALAGGTVFALLLIGCSLASALLAAKDRKALAAERQARDMQQKAQQAELARQVSIAESAARAQRRMKAFGPYAEATDLLMRGQQFDRAVQLLERATRIDAEFPEAQLALGEAYRLNGLPGPAAQAYLRASDLNQKITGQPHVQALLAAGMTFDGSGEYKKAEDAFIRAERAGGNQPLALVGKAIRLGNGRRLREARGPAEEAVRRGPHLWETHFALGYVMEELAEQGFLPPEPTRSQAIASMRKALELSPRQAEVWYWLGLALLRTGKPEDRAEALRAMGRSVALEPRNGNRYIGSGQLRLSQGDLAGAAADFQKARDLKASRALILHVDAMMANGRGDYSTAFRLLGKIIQSGQSWPSHIGNWLVLGYNLHRDNEVRDRYERWCRENSEYPEVYRLKAQLKARDGDLAGALAEVRTGLKIAPFNRKLRLEKASCLLERRDWAGALKAADAVLGVSANDFAAQTIRVRCLAALGRGAEAKALVDRLQKDFPRRFREIDALRRDLAARLPK